MRSGRLRHRVTIQQLGMTAATWGAAETWSTYKTCWAAIEPLRAREMEQAERFSSEVSATIVIRYDSGVTAAMRVSWEGRIFRIVGVVDPDYRHRELQLYVVEGSDDQS